MREIWIIARHEYLVNLRRTGFIAWTLAVPVIGLLVLVVAAVFGGSASDFLANQFNGEPQQVGFVDHSGLLTPILPEYSDRFTPYADRASGSAAVTAGDISALLIVPEDYVESGQVTIVSSSSTPDFQVLDEAEDFLVANLLRDNVPPAVAERITDPLEPVMVGVDAGQEDGSPQGVVGIVAGFLVPYLLAVLLIVTIFTSSGYLLRGIAEEKTGRVIEILLSSVTARQLLAGKVLGLGALGLTQVVVWLGSAVALSGGALGIVGFGLPLLSQPRLVILSVVYYLLGFSMFAVLMGASGALGTTQQESQQIAGMFSFAAAIPMMLTSYILANPNSVLPRVLSWFPLTAPTMVMIRMSMTNIPVIDIVGSIAMCALSVPLIVWGGAKLFRAGLLMYGKRPTLREVIQLLRAA